MLGSGRCSDSTQEQPKKSRSPQNYVLLQFLIEFNNNNTIVLFCLTLL